MAEKKRLTDANVAKLAPGASEYTVRDSVMPGLGVRVRPAGHRGYVFYCTVDGRIARHSLGPVHLRSIEAVRRECFEILSTPPAECHSAAEPSPLFGDFVTGRWKDDCYRRCKPSTREGFDSQLKSQLLPAFGALPLDRITRGAIHKWFDGYSETAPGGANKTLDTLSQILNHAERCGHVATNPARGIRRNRRPRLSRFLSKEEICRLLETLDRCEAERPASRPQADIIRLLLFTGCRRGEILNLRWDEVADNLLRLRDSKTGPRRVFLNSEAGAIIARQPRTTSPHVFPAPADMSRARSFGGLDGFWRKVRNRAGLQDVRLHDLRHTVASQAVLAGVPLPVVSKLLGHSQASMTLRYAHVHDAETEAAAERVGNVIAEICGFPR